MGDFSHLQPAERLFIARHRLGMLSSVLIEVLELNEQKKAFASSRFYTEGKNDPAVDLLFNTIIKYEIVQICRLWDGFDSAGFSLPTITSLLQGPDVRELLTGSGAVDGQVVVHLHGSSIEEFVPYFDAAVEEASATADSEEIKRIKNYRNKFIAHAVYHTREETRKSMKTVSPDDIEFAVGKASRIIQVFDRALRSNGPDYLDVITQAGRNLKTFHETLQYPIRM